MLKGKQQGREFLLDVRPRIDDIGAVIGEGGSGRGRRLEGLQMDGNVAGNKSIANYDLPAPARLGIEHPPTIADPDPQPRAAG